jgi:serine/threonine protein kinase
LGVITNTLLTGQLPFDSVNASHVLAKIRSGKCEYPSSMSSNAVKFLRRMLLVNPSLRASIEELKSHPWIQGIPDSSSVDVVTAAGTSALAPLSSIGDRFRKIAFRRRSLANGSHAHFGGRSHLSVPHPIKSLVPDRVPLKQLPGSHPDPQITAILKKDPFAATDLTSGSPFIGATLDDGSPIVVPAGLWLQRTVRHIRLTDPLTFGFGRGFGFEAEEVDHILETAMNSPLVLTA